MHVVVPEGIEDPTRPSGGNTYDRRLCDHLAAGGWSVCVRAVAGEWPRAGEAARRALAQTFASIADDELVLVDGLVASARPGGDGARLSPTAVGAADAHTVRLPGRSSGVVESRA